MMRTEREMKPSTAKQTLSEEAHERQSPRREIVYRAIMMEGEDELSRTSSSLAWSGFAAGMSMGFSLISEGLLQFYLPTSSWQHLGTKLGYSVGFVIVILGRQQFFTENTLTVILPLLVKKNLETFVNVLRLWGVVLIANLVGVMIITLVLAETSVLDPRLHDVIIKLSLEATQPSFGVALLRGIFAGWLIALMVWLMPFADVARVTVIVLLTYLIGLAGFPHVIAGSSKDFYLVVKGLRPFMETVTTYLVPALIGNVIGGVAIVAALAHAQVIHIEEAGEVNL